MLHTTAFSLSGSEPLPLNQGLILLKAQRCSHNKQLLELLSAVGKSVGKISSSLVGRRGWDGSHRPPRRECCSGPYSAAGAPSALSTPSLAEGTVGVLGAMLASVAGPAAAPGAGDLAAVKGGSVPLLARAPGSGCHCPWGLPGGG